MPVKRGAFHESQLVGCFLFFIVQVLIQYLLYSGQTCGKKGVDYIEHVGRTYYQTMFIWRANFNHWTVGHIYKVCLSVFW